MHTEKIRRYIHEVNILEERGLESTMDMREAFLRHFESRFTMSLNSVAMSFTANWLTFLG